MPANRNTYWLRTFGDPQTALYWEPWARAKFEAMDDGVAAVFQRSLSPIPGVIIHLHRNGSMREIMITAGGVVQIIIDPYVRDYTGQKYPTIPNSWSDGGYGSFGRPYTDQYITLAANSDIIATGQPTSAIKGDIVGTSCWVDQTASEAVSWDVFEIFYKKTKYERPLSTDDPLVLPSQDNRNFIAAWLYAGYIYYVAEYDPGTPEYTELWRCPVEQWGQTQDMGSHLQTYHEAVTMRDTGSGTTGTQLKRVTSDSFDRPFISPDGSVCIILSRQSKVIIDLNPDGAFTEPAFTHVHEYGSDADDPVYIGERQRNINNSYLRALTDLDHTLTKTKTVSIKWTSGRAYEELTLNIEVRYKLEDDDQYSESPVSGANLRWQKNYREQIWEKWYLTGFLTETIKDYYFDNVFITDAYCVAQDDNWGGEPYWWRREFSGWTEAAFAGGPLTTVYTQDYTETGKAYATLEPNINAIAYRNYISEYNYWQEKFYVQSASFFPAYTKESRYQGEQVNISLRGNVVAGRGDPAIDLRKKTVKEDIFSDPEEITEAPYVAGDAQFFTPQEEAYDLTYDFTVREIVTYDSGSSGPQHYKNLIRVDDVYLSIVMPNDDPGINSMEGAEDNPEMLNAGDHSYWGEWLLWMNEPGTYTYGQLKNTWIGLHFSTTQGLTFIEDIIDPAERSSDPDDGDPPHSGWNQNPEDVVFYVTATLEA